MLAFLVQRISQAVLVMFVISVIAFAIQDGLGDPLQQMVGMSVSQDERAAIREEMGLNDPLVVQYVRFAGNALQGDLGISYFYGKPTMDVILEHLPATLELVIGASLIIVIFSVPIGAFSHCPQPASCGNQSTVTPIEKIWISTMAVRNTGMEIPTVLTPMKNLDNQA